MLNRINTRVRPFTGGHTTLDVVSDERADILTEVGMTEDELRTQWQDRTEAQTRALRRLDALVWAERAV